MTTDTTSVDALRTRLARVPGGCSTRWWQRYGTSTANASRSSWKARPDCAGARQPSPLMSSLRTGGRIDSRRMRPTLTSPAMSTTSPHPRSTRVPVREGLGGLRSGLWWTGQGTRADQLQPRKKRMTEPKQIKGEVVERPDNAEPGISLGGLEYADDAIDLPEAEYVVTETTLAKAFTEWDQRYREEPERFYSEAEHLLKMDAETYGEQCASYLIALLTGAV